MSHVMSYIEMQTFGSEYRKTESTFLTRRKTMNDLFEDFNSTKAGEVAVGVFVAIAAFKLAKGIVRACFD